MTRVPALLAMVALAAACSSSPDVPHGAPVLFSVYWYVGGSRYTIWSSPDAPDPAQVTTVPPLGSEVDFVFNRRLDGSRIEDTVAVDGGSVEQTKAVPPITLAGDAQAADPSFHLDVLYNSLPIFGGQTSYVLVRPLEAGFPSATALTFQIDRSSITSPYDEPLGMPDSVPITTQAFSVGVGLPAASDGGLPVVAGTYQLPLNFSNRPSSPAVAAPFVHVRLHDGGAELPITLIADPLAPPLLRVVPGGCLNAWPAGATLDVTVDPGLPDVFGIGMAAAATASFTILPGAGDAGAGASCLSSPDGGAAD